MRRSYLQNHYNISETAEGYQFVTDNDVVYLISFIKYPLPDENQVFSFYSFNIDRCSIKKGQDDVRVRNTIAFVIDMFFQKHNDALMSVTDCSDSRQAVRHRLFFRWFNELNNNYLKKIEGMIHIDDVDVFVSLLYKLDTIESSNMISIFQRLIDNNLYY